ncbi:AraC family transcriptional regulator [Microbulbifer hainanensis]|uniref:AraC family transcriptional regulator n=1 Tax=Microbulbifer hainanensis TaxID=2735675 RepID=UPI0018691662|nr:AraC family transcriptional regulator [Microbulbifer hainanensis]
MSNQTKQYNYLIYPLVETLSQLGVDYEPIFRSAGIVYERVNKNLELITKQQYATLCFELIQKIDEPGLGLKIGENTDLNDQGAAGYLIMTSKTLREAEERYSKYRGLITTVVDSQCKITESEISWRYMCDTPLEKLHRLYIEWAMASHQVIMQTLIGVKAQPLKLLLDFPEPEYIDIYRRIFHCEISFDQPHAEIHYPAKLIDEPLPTYDPMVEGAMAELCERLQIKINENHDVISDVKEHLRKREGYFPSLESIADQMHVSSRTLHRKLKSKNTNFQTLLDEARQELAQQYLLETDLQIQQIAERCGFSEAQNFSIAFKRWVGLSPTEYRQKYKK